MDCIDSAYAELAAAIVRQACSDYLAVERHKSRGKKPRTISEWEVLWFFGSRWCAQLCGDIIPAELLKRLICEGKVANAIKNNKADKRFAI